MTGKELKDKLAKQGIPASAIAEKIGISPQAINSTFNAADVKSGTLERIANVLGVNMSFFYPTEGSGVSIAGNNNISGNNNAVGNVTIGDAAVLHERVKFLEQQVKDKESLLAEKERLIKVLMEK